MKPCSEKVSDETVGAPVDASAAGLLGRHVVGRSDGRADPREAAGNDVALLAGMVVWKLGAPSGGKVLRASAAGRPSRRASSISPAS